MTDLMETSRDPVTKLSQSGPRFIAEFPSDQKCLLPWDSPGQWWNERLSSSRTVLNHPCVFARGLLSLSFADLTAAALQ